MKVKFAHYHKDHIPGQVVELPDDEARGLVNAGVAHFDEVLARPSKSASRAAWVAYVTAESTEGHITEAEAEDLTIAQLQERFPEPSSDE